MAHWVGTGSAQVAVVRWGEVLTDAEAHVVTPREPAEGVSLVAEELETLSVQPHVERVRLLGEHFDLNKSFRVPEGLPGARAIAKDRARCVSLLPHPPRPSR